MTLNLSALPTSEAELEAQIEDAFSQDDGPEPSTSKAAPKTETPEPEYIPPDSDGMGTTPSENGEIACAYVMWKSEKLLNMVGVQGFNDEEIEKVSSAVGEVAGFYPRIFSEKGTPKQRAMWGLVAAIGSVALGRALDNMTKGQAMRDVTPETPAPDADKPVQEGAPIYG